MKTEDMSLSQIITEVANSIPQKIYETLSTWPGALMSSLVYCGMFLGGRLPLLAYIAIAVTIDGLWGVSTALKADKFIFSKLLAKSAVKIAAYSSVYGLVALVEKGFTDGNFMVGSSIIAAILISSELWSTLGHIAIRVPDWLPIKILKLYLKGEMAKKLGIPESKLDEVLSADKNKHNNESKNKECESNSK